MTAGAILGADGPLATALADFQARPTQQAMADTVADALTGQRHLILEAGTGTGKTYAYLAAIFSVGRRALISTATKTLQDQLFTRDIPRVARALASHGKVALLKGRANYLCLLRLDQSLTQASLWPEAAAQLQTIYTWSRTTTSGDIAELTTLPEEAAIWPAVTSTVDNCLGQSCPQFEQCFVVKARRRANAADLVVVNHHLLFADMSLREEGFGELLPSVDVVIADEAHQLPELAAQAFGRTLSSRRLRDLLRDSAAAGHSEAPDTPDLTGIVARAESALQRAVTTFGRHPGRQEFASEAAARDTQEALDDIYLAFETLRAALAEISERGPALARCAERTATLLAHLQAFSDASDHEWVRWSDASVRGFALHQSPLEVAAQFQQYLAQYAAPWVFCSATLAIDGDFAHFQRELGLEDAHVAHFDSPFDYARQGLLLLPKLRVAPNEPAYLAAVTELACEVITRSRGRAFLLSTSYRAVAHYAAPLRARLPYPVLVQGEAPRAELLAEFARLGNAILIGTATFWEGVDVRGEALSCVIIDKLPFATPDDPLLRARVRKMAAEGLDAFREFQVPVAALALKQGAGRLIRDVTDRGTLVLCDPRLLTKSYGKTFLRAIPPMPRTHALEDVAQFFTE